MDKISFFSRTSSISPLGIYLVLSHVYTNSWPDFKLLPNRYRALKVSPKKDFLSQEHSSTLSTVNSTSYVTICGLVRINSEIPKVWLLDGINLRLRYTRG